MFFLYRRASAFIETLLWWSFSAWRKLRRPLTRPSSGIGKTTAELRQGKDSSRFGWGKSKQFRIVFTPLIIIGKISETEE